MSVGQCPGLLALWLALVGLPLVGVGALVAQEVDSRDPEPVSGTASPRQPAEHAAFRLGLLEECEDGEIRLDLGEVKHPSGPGLVFDGSAALLICAEDSDAVGDAARKELNALFLDFLKQYHFYMTALCRAELLEIDGRALLIYELERAKLFGRISAVVPPPIARGFACRSGWTHYR